MAIGIIIGLRRAPLPEPDGIRPLRRETSRTMPMAAPIGFMPFRTCVAL